MATIYLAYSPQTRVNYYGERALARLQALGEVRLNQTEIPLTPADLAREAAGCDIIVAPRIPAATAELFDNLPQLVAYCRGAVDIRTVDVAAAGRNGVLVTHATPGFAASVAEWVLGAMFDLSRNISDAVMAYRSGLVPEVRMGRELRGATLGVAGYGTIGQYLCRIAQALGMKVLVADPYARIEDPAHVAVGFDALLAQSDYVVCLAPANAETAHMFNAAAFAKMQASAYFINASRGELVDEAALLQALEQGVIAACAVDVGMAPDQMPSPLLARHPRVIATPHIGGLTPQAAEHQAMDTVNQVAAIVAGRMPQGAVNAAQATRLARFSA
ncbi:hydroxyacid dehydrogenase [Herbaspirillum rhizosphaerae]|uniref:hydroxyacid dehydrogenase n=1 Tax=Herbaspirillum rhizosphaerae TaxID=346179 RepID=UPI00067C592B|nr:hydroxyacid dehydrogenase [Herbaspirillum rhizosphaerae]